MPLSAFFEKKIAGLNSFRVHKNGNGMTMRQMSSVRVTENVMLML